MASSVIATLSVGASAASSFFGASAPIGAAGSDFHWATP
jgi:hypothetical protein